MAYVIEEAKSGRSKCRGCNQAIAKGELRFGELLPNPFADDSDMTLWFHLACAALRRPTAFEEALEDPVISGLEQLQTLRGWVAQADEHYRLDRITGVERAPSSRARCRHCKETIEKDTWRIPLVFFEEGMFNASGSVHAGCAAGYFGDAEILDRLVHFTPDLDPGDQEEIREALASPGD